MNGFSLGQPQAFKNEGTGVTGTQLMHGVLQCADTDRDKQDTNASQAFQ